MNLFTHVVNAIGLYTYKWLKQFILDIFYYVYFATQKTYI